MLSVRRYAPAAVLALLLTSCSGGGSSAGAGTTGGSGTSGGSNAGGGTAAVTDVLTYHNDTMRSGQNLTESTLTPENVTAAIFGKLRLLAADGRVDAQPLVVSGLIINGAAHNVVYVATEHDSVFAYDADMGALLARASMLGSGETPSDPRNCSQVSPEIGITATPVIDRSAGPNGTLFVVAMSMDASGNYYQRLHALDLTTLADRITPRVVQANAPGSGANSSGGTLSFDPKQYKERAALLLLKGTIYTSWASHCDIEPYNGWIIAYDESNLTQTQVLNITPNGTEASIWHTGGLAADSGGNIYAISGNGSFETALDAGGLPSGHDFGNAVLRIPTGDSALSVGDYFTMWNTVAESAADQDFGSGSPLLLPDQQDGAGTTWHLLVAAGKDRNLYILNRDNLGKFDPASNHVYQELDDALPSGGLYSAPIYFNGTVYVGGAGDALAAFALSAARFPTTPSSQTTATFAYPGTSPAVSANGTSDGIVWALESNLSQAAVLHAYDPANLAHEYYNSNQAGNNRDNFGTGNKFITPTVANGKVFVGTPSGVAVFGLL